MKINKCRICGIKPEEFSRWGSDSVNEPYRRLYSFLECPECGQISKNTKEGHFWKDVVESWNLENPEQGEKDVACD